VISKPVAEAIPPEPEIRRSHAAANLFFRDVQYVFDVIVLVWMFASPVIYPPTFVPQKWRWLLKLNPMTGIIDGFRAAIFGGKTFDWLSLATSTAVALVLLVYAAYSFRRMERSFADVI